MKQSTKWFAAALAVAGGLAVPSPLKASNLTLSDFSNFSFSATYANWDPVGSQLINGGSGYTPTITSGPTDLRVVAQAYGSAAYNFPAPINASGATGFALTFTINHTMPSLWFGPNVYISDNAHQVALTAVNAGGGFLSFGNYVGPGTYTLVGGLTDQFGGNPLDVSNITAFNLEVNPAAYGDGNLPYDITYDHFELTGIPEPTSFALAGLGFAGLLISRRFKK